MLRIVRLYGSLPSSTGLVNLTGAKRGLISSSMMVSTAAHVGHLNRQRRGEEET